MAELQCYAKLGVVLDGVWLQEQFGVVIDDDVRRPCRVTIASAVPESGIEVDARKKLGEPVRVAVHIVQRPGVLGPELLAMDGVVVASSTRQPLGDGFTVAEFTVEHRTLGESHR
jgi:hypothetical protein